MQVLGNIEQSFNDIWEVKHSRNFARKFTDYIALMIVALLVLVSSSSMVVSVSDKFNDYETLNSVWTMISSISSHAFMARLTVAALINCGRAPSTVRIFIHIASA